MTEVRTAIAIRIPRPWHTEAEFIHNEVETISRTGILLLGTHSRPQGTILRFEVTLAGGEPLVRGEGRVVSYNQVAFRGEPGLLLRFTRLDPRSKEFVDRVAAVRRQEGMVSMAPPSMSPPLKVEPGHESSSMSSTGEIGILSSKLIVAASAFPLPMEAPYDATIAPPAAMPTEAPPPAMATMAAPPLMHMHSSTNPPESTGAFSSAPPASQPLSQPLSQPGAPRSRRSVPPPLPAAARRSAPPSARTSAPPPPPPSLRDASPFEALREQVEARMARRPATPPPPPVLPDADVVEVVEAAAPASAPASRPSAEIHPIDAWPSIPALPPEPIAETSAPAVATVATATAAKTVTAPANREDLLRRLRTRASAMPASERAKILTPRAR